MIAFVFIALTVPGFVLAVRTLPWVDAKVLAGVKPWACDVCSCFWSTVIWSLIGVAFFGSESLIAAPPAYTLALCVLGLMSQPPAAPPTLPGGP